MKVLLLIVLTVSVCNNVKINLVRLGDYISDRLYGFSGDGTVLKRDIRRYYVALKKLAVGLEKASPNAIKVYRKIKDQLGPPHLECKLYNVLFVRVFGWSWKQEERVEEYIGKTKKLWEKIEKIAENKSLDSSSSSVI